MSKPRVESAISCPSCRSPVEEHLDFCHSCGQTMIAVFSDRPKRHRTPYIYVAVAILALACAVIMALTIYDFVRQYGVPGGADVTERASRYISQGQEESAINLLEESLAVKGDGGPEQKVWRLMLDQALFSRGKKLAAAGKFRDAVTAFARVSANFAGHEDVEKLIAEYTDKGLPSVFGRAQDVDPSLDKEKRPMSKLEKAVMTAVPGGKEHVDPLPSSIRGEAIGPDGGKQATGPSSER